MSGGLALSGEGAILLVREDNLPHSKVLVHLLQRILDTVETFTRKRVLSSFVPLFQPQLSFENKEGKENQQKNLDSQKDG
jgi:hypothetical protein